MQLWKNHVVEDLKKENEKLKAKLERTKEHAQRQRIAEEEANQKIYDELYAENEKLRAALDEAVDLVTLLHETFVTCQYVGVRDANAESYLFLAKLGEKK